MKSFRPLFVFPIALIAALFALPIRSDTNPSRTMASAYVDPDAYQVYSAVLPMDTWYWQSSKTLLIVQELPPKEWPIGSPRDALRGNAEFSKTFGSMFKSFEQLSRESLLLEPRFAISKPYKLVGRAELDEAFHRPAPNAADDGWSGFRQNFPGAAGYLILSAVAFNPKKTSLWFTSSTAAAPCGERRAITFWKNGTGVGLSASRKVWRVR